MNNTFFFQHENFSMTFTSASLIPYLRLGDGRPVLHLAAAGPADTGNGIHTFPYMLIESFFSLAQMITAIRSSKGMYILNVFIEPGLGISNNLRLRRVR